MARFTETVIAGTDRGSSRARGGGKWKFDERECRACVDQAALWARKKCGAVVLRTAASVVSSEIAAAGVTRGAVSQVRGHVRGLASVWIGGGGEMVSRVAGAARQSRDRESKLRDGVSRWRASGFRKPRGVDPLALGLD
jgi:hypothetical protein